MKTHRVPDRNGSANIFPKCGWRSISSDERVVGESERWKTRLILALRRCVGWRGRVIFTDQTFCRIDRC